MERQTLTNGEAMPKITNALAGITFAGSIAPVAVAATHPADALSFVRRRQDSAHIDWWAVEDGADFRADLPWASAWAASISISSAGIRHMGIACFSGISSPAWPTQSTSAVGLAHRLPASFASSTNMPWHLQPSSPCRR